MKINEVEKLMRPRSAIAAPVDTKHKEQLLTALLQHDHFNSRSRAVRFVPKLLGGILLCLCIFILLINIASFRKSNFVLAGVKNSTQAELEQGKTNFTGLFSFTLFDCGSEIKCNTKFKIEKLLNLENGDSQLSVSDSQGTLLFREVNSGGQIFVGGEEVQVGSQQAVTTYESKYMDFGMQASFYTPDSVWAVGGCTFLGNKNLWNSVVDNNCQVSVKEGEWNGEKGKVVTLYSKQEGFTELGDRSDFQLKVFLYFDQDYQLTAAEHFIYKDGKWIKELEVEIMKYKFSKNKLKFNYEGLTEIK